MGVEHVLIPASRVPVSYGDSLEDAYIVTTKPIHVLDPQAARLQTVLPNGMQSSMMPVQQAMNAMVGRMIYRNMYKYQLAQHASSFTPESELATFGAVPLDVSSGKIGKAFEPVRAALNRYHDNAYSLYGFRISAY